MLFDDRGILGLNLYNIRLADLEVEAGCLAQDRHRIILFRCPFSLEI